MDMWTRRGCRVGDAERLGGRPVGGDMAVNERRRQDGRGGEAEMKHGARGKVMGMWGGRKGGCGNRRHAGLPLTVMRILAAGWG